MHSFHSHSAGTASAPRSRAFAWRGGAAARFLAGIAVAGAALNAGAQSASASGALDALTFNTARTATFHNLTGWTPRVSAAKSGALALPGVSALALANGMMNPMVVTTHIWNSGVTTGSWNTSSNWSNGVPNTIGDIASLSASGSTITTSLDSSVTIGQLTNTNTSGWTIGAGGGTLTMDNTGGSVSAFSATTDSAIGNTNVAGGKITLNPNIVVANKDLDIGNASTNGSALTIAGNITASTAQNLKFYNNNAGTIAVSGSIGASGSNIAISNLGTSTGPVNLNGSIGSSVTSITENSSGSALTVNGAITLGGSGLTLMNNAGTFSVKGGVTGTGDLTLAGNTNITITNAAAINNTGKIIDTNSAFNSLGLIGANVTSVVQNVTSPSLFSVLVLNSNAGGFATGNAGVFGTVTAQSGIIKVGPNAVSAGNVFAFTGSGGVLDLGSNNLTIAGLTDTGTLGTVTNSGTIGILTLGGSGTYAFGGAIGSTTGYTTGTANDPTKLGITKSGTGTQTLSGANIYAGGTTISGGTLQLSGSGTLGATTGALGVSSTGILDLNGTSQTVGVLTGTGGTILNNGSGTSTLTIGNGGSDTGGIIKDNAGTGGTLALSVSSGVILGGANAYSGGTTVNSSFLQLNSASGAGTGNIALTSGTGGTTGSSLLINNTGTTANSVSGAGYLENFNGTAGTITLTGALSYTGNTYFRVANNAIKFSSSGNNTLSGVIGATSGGYLGNETASGSITQAGTGTLTLTGANTYTGATTVSGGILNIQNNTALGTTAGGTSVSSGATLQVQGGITVGAEALSLTGTGATGTSGALENVSGTNSYGGAITLGGNTTIGTDSGSTLTLSGSDQIASSTLTFNSVGTTNVTGQLASSNGTGGTLIKSGAGTVVLSNTSNNYTGTNSNALPLNGTQINAGVLGLSADSNLGLTGGGAFQQILFTGGSTLQDTSNNISLSSFRNIGINTGVTASLDSNGNTFTINSIIQNNSGNTASGIAKTGTGTVLLTGTNTYSGLTAINAGTLSVQNGNAIPDGSAVSIANVTGATLNLANNETIGSLTGGVNSKVTLGSLQLLTGADNTSTAFAGIISGTSGTLVKQGTGTFTLSGANTYTGQTAIDAGTLRVDTTPGATGGTNFVGNGGTTTTAASLLLGGASNGTGGGVSYGNAISINPGNGGDRTLGGTNTTGTNTFSGNIALDGAFGENRSVTITEPAGGNVWFTGAISGAGQGVTKTGVGTATLTGTNTYTGATSVNAGTLVVNGSTVAGSAVSVSSGATLTGTGTVAGTVTDQATGIINAGTVGTTGTLTTGAVSFAGGSTLGFDFNATTADLLNSTGAFSFTGTGTSVINLIGNQLVAPNPSTIYTLATFASGLAGTPLSDFSLSGISGYTLSINNNSLILTPTPTTTGTIYTLVATASAANLRAGSGATATITSKITNTGTGTADTLNYTGLNVSASIGTLAGGTLPKSGGPLANNGGNESGTTTYTVGSSAGTVNFNPTVTSATNATLNTAATLGTTTNGTLNVYSGQTSYVGTGGNYLTGGSNAVQQTQWADGGAPGVDGAPYTGTDTASFASNGTVSVNAAVNLKALALGGGTTLATDGVGGHGFTLQSGSGTATVTATGTGNAISAPVTLATSTTATVTSSGDTLTVSGNISGTGSLTKAGAGTLTLTGVDSATGTTTVSAGTLALANTGGGAITGTGDNITVSGSGAFVTAGNASNGVLSLGAANQLKGATDSGQGQGGTGGTAVTLSGGTLELNGKNQGTTSNSGSPRMGGNGGVTESSFGAGLLTVSGGNSYLDFGAGNTGAVFTFSGYDLSSTGTLYIENYNDGNFTGTYAGASGGGIDQLFFGNGQYSVQELMHVYFVNPIGAGGGVKTGIWEAKLLSTGEVVAPEPSAWASLLVGTLGLAGLAIKARRRKAVDAAA